MFSRFSNELTSGTNDLTEILKKVAILIKDLSRQSWQH